GTRESGQPFSRREGGRFAHDKAPAGKRHPRDARHRLDAVQRDDEDDATVPRAAVGHPGTSEEVLKDLGLLMGKGRAELEVSAGGIVFRRQEGEQPRYLLIKDSYDNWGFPKGHLENGESPADAARRETGEETGLDHLTLQGPIRVIDWHFRFRGRHIHKYCHFFLFESPAGDAS